MLRDGHIRASFFGAGQVLVYVHPPPYRSPATRRVLADVLDKIGLACWVVPLLHDDD